MDENDGQALLVEAHAADVRDRDGGGALVQASRSPFPFIRLFWADGGYNHEFVANATNIRIEIVSKITG